MLDKFNEIYEKVYIESNEELEELRRKEKKKIIISLILFFLILVVCFLFRKILIISMLMPTIVMIMFVLLLIALKSKTGFMRNSYREVYKEKVIKTFIKAYNENLEYNPNGIISSREYRMGQFEQHFDRYSSEDLITGDIDGTIIKIAEVHTEDKHTDKDGHTHYSTIFHGMYGMILLKKSVDGTIKIHSDKLKLFNGGKSRVEMDSTEFEKYFDVYADNKIQAMQILTSDIMDEMIRFYEKYKIKYEITILPGTLCIRFRNGNVFEGNIMKRALDMDTLRKNYDMINFIFNISKRLSDTIDEKEF